MRTAPLLLVLLFVLLLVPSFAAAASFTFTNNTNYTIEDKTYTILPMTKNGTGITHDGFNKILKIKECLDFTYTRTCLSAASETSATFTETFTGPVLKVSAALEETRGGLAEQIEGTITITNTGEQEAKDVEVRMDFPEELVLSTGSQEFTWKGIVNEQSQPQFRFTPRTNKTYSFGGVVSYFDGKETKQLDIRNMTFTATLPFTYTVKYDAMATKGSFSVNITKKTSDNESYKITLLTPPEMQVSSNQTRVNIDEGIVTFRDTVNTSETKTGCNVSYIYTGYPSAPIELDIEYKENNHTKHVKATYNFSFPEDPDPSLAIKIDSLIAKETGSIIIIITGNRTGTLVLSGDLISDARSVTSGTHQIIVRPTTPGNVTLAVSFKSTDCFGTQSETHGNITVLVSAASPIAETTSVLNETQNTTNNTRDSTTPSIPQPEKNLLEQTPLSTPIIMAGVAAFSLFTVLMVIIVNIRDPLKRLERLSAELTAARTALIQKGKLEKLSVVEEEKLKALEQELDEINHSL